METVLTFKVGLPVLKIVFLPKITSNNDSVDSKNLTIKSTNSNESSYDAFCVLPALSTEGEESSSASSKLSFKVVPFDTRSFEVMSLSIHHMSLKDDLISPFIACLLVCLIDDIIEVWP